MVIYERFFKNTAEDFKSYQAESDHTVAHFEKEYPELSQEFKEIDRLKNAYPSLKREDLYEKAYQNVMKT